MNQPKLIAFGDYTAPATPTEHALRLAWTRVKQKLSGPKEPLLRGLIVDDKTRAMLDDTTGPPNHGLMLQAYDEQFGAWSRDTNSQPTLRTIVVPPCDTTGILAHWARSRGHTLLLEPDRIELAQLTKEGWQPNLSGDGLLVIPRLESWFLRERNGLHALRSLLAQVAKSERRCLIGCNSWAWHFIVKTAGADLSLPSPKAFESLDALQLRDWFAALATDKDGLTATFRLAGNGEDVLALKQDGELCNAYLKQLAALSLGIPWVAWHLWRAGQRVNVDKQQLPDHAAKMVAGDARTAWMVEIDDEVELPPSHESRALLVLQALLIHGTLTPTELDTVLPTTGEPDMLASLVASGHLQREPTSDCHRIRPTAYPAVRKALKSAGFPTGVM